MKGDLCRKRIEERGLRPNVKIRNSRKYWDGITAIRPNGEEAFLSGGMAVQMRKMVKDSYWPDLRDVIRDRSAV